MGRIVSSGEASSVTQPGQKMSGWYGHASYKNPDRGWLLTVHGRNGDDVGDVMDGDEDGHGGMRVRVQMKMTGEGMVDGDYYVCDDR